MLKFFSSNKIFLFFILILFLFILQYFYIKLIYIPEIQKHFSFLPSNIFLKTTTFITFSMEKIVSIMNYWIILALLFFVGIIVLFGKINGLLKEAEIIEKKILTFNKSYRKAISVLTIFSKIFIIIFVIFMFFSQFWVFKSGKILKNQCININSIKTDSNKR